MNFQLRLLRGLQTNVREIESKPPEKFENKCGLQMYSSDLLIPITWKSGGFEKSPEKLGDWDLKQGDFQNMHQIEKNNNNRLFVCVFFYLFSAPFFILLLPFPLSSSGQ